MSSRQIKSMTTNNELRITIYNQVVIYIKVIYFNFFLIVHE